MQLRIPFSNAPHHKRIARLIKRNTFFLRNCVRSLHEQIRVLKPEGQFVMCQADLLSLYPLRSRGQKGGIRWLKQLGKGTIYKNYHCGLPMKDEEIHTRFYWRQLLEAAGLQEIRLPFKVIAFLGTIYMTERKSSHEKEWVELTK